MLNNNDFTKELLALLEKHNASIHWGCGPCSDLHGVYDERMFVKNRKNETLLEIEGYEISAYEIKGIT